jgi:uncharacterized iron-regulated membrane protein
MRNLFLVIHRWLGLTVGVFFAVASLTGAVLVYEPELEALLNRGRFPSAAALLDGAALEQALRDAIGSAELRAVRWPTPREPAFVVERITDGRRSTIYLDAGSGAVVEPLRGRSPWIAGIRRIHTTLLAGRVGHWVVILTSTAALLGLISGAIVWWPGIRHFWRGFVIRMRRGAYIANYDLHQALGMITLPLLLLLTITGVAIPFPGLAERVARSVMPAGQGLREWSAVRSTPPADAAPHDPPGIARLVLTAQRMVGRDAVPESITFPERAGGVIDVRLRTGSPLAAGAVTRVLFDRYSGQLLQLRDPHALDRAAHFARNGVFNLHTGAFGGTAVRIIWCVACIVGGVLLPTGVTVWWMKRTRKALAAELRSAGNGSRR